ncbi:cobalamin biosynthesis protein CobT [Paraburkholderia sp.]|uniref:cobaltochelatase CobT-related protein n=1 Tax=Paraburkholderia sp. TaxID=1926495 RepID=UPI0023888F55|nr:cobalamin biosynthesis protein CobT [Paraburkholderia sp.]MDE1181732.1 cobalamin biosynthesis protein CobT [Paraburkholderia sp.]
MAHSRTHTQSHAARDTRGFEFESTLGKIARVLTGQYGVSVVFSPDGPRVERGRIVIPEYDVGESVSRDVLTGYLDLLVARAKHSSLDAIAALPQDVSASLAQIVEDRRVCAALLDEYPGARWFVGKLRAHAAANTHARWNTLRWRDRFLWRVERMLWHEPAESNEGSHSLDAALHASQECIDAARHSMSTAQSIATAHAIVARVRQLSAGDANPMAFTADADEDIDAESIETLLNPDDPFSDASPASPRSQRESGTDRDQPQPVGMGHSPTDASASSDLQPGTPPARSTRTARPSLSIPLSTEFDVITDQTGAGDSAAWRAIRAAARAQTAPLRDKLERALSADERTRWKREQERGELDRTALAKLATTPGYRTPFRVQRTTQGRDVAVTLLIDRSGSMAGKKIELAQLCAAALCDALMQLSFDCEVLGYSSVESEPMKRLVERQRAAGADLSRYNRFVERLDLQIYKRFGSADPSGLANLDCGHENPDGEALAWAATRLADHQAARRILIVFSDGYPATGDGDPQVLRTDLRRRIDAIGQRGIELVGIGVLTDAVESFYPHNVVVSRLAELPSTVFSVLSAMLLKRGTHTAIPVPTI